MLQTETVEVEVLDLEERLAQLRLSLASGNLAEAAKHSNAAQLLEKALLEEGAKASAAGGGDPALVAAAEAIVAAGPNADLAKLSAECNERVAEAQGRAAADLLEAVEAAAAAAAASPGGGGGGGGGGDWAAVVHALTELASTVFGRPMMKNAAARAGAVRRVAAAMGGVALSHALVQRAGCKALRTLCFHHEANNRAAAGAGAIGAIAVALRAHRGDAAAQSEGLWALMVLCKYSENTAVVAKLAAGAAAAAMEAHPADGSVRAKAMGLGGLLSMASESSEKAFPSAPDSVVPASSGGGGGGDAGAAVVEVAAAAAAAAGGGGAAGAAGAAAAGQGGSLPPAAPDPE